MNREHRRFARINTVNMPIALSPISTNNEVIYDLDVLFGEVVDISASGLLISSWSSIRPGMRYRADIEMNSNNVSFFGVIRWSHEKDDRENEYLQGFEITGATEADVTAFAEYMRQLCDGDNLWLKPPDTTSY